MVSSYNLDVSKIKKYYKNIRYEIIFQLFKFWFGQLDSDNLKYAECGNIQPDSWQLMNHTVVDYKAGFTQFSLINHRNVDALLSEVLNVQSELSEEPPLTIWSSG